MGPEAGDEGGSSPRERRKVAARPQARRAGANRRRQRGCVMGIPARRRPGPQRRGRMPSEPSDFPPPGRLAGDLDINQVGGDARNAVGDRRPPLAHPRARRSQRQPARWDGRIWPTWSIGSGIGPFQPDRLERPQRGGNPREEEVRRLVLSRDHGRGVALEDEVPHDAGHVQGEEIVARLDLKPLNEMPDLPLYGTEPRTRCRNLRGPWQEIGCGSTAGRDRPPRVPQVPR